LRDDAEPELQLTMLHVLQVVSVTLVAVALAFSLAHAAKFPGKLRLSQKAYLAVQPIYDSGSGGPRNRLPLGREEHMRDGWKRPEALAPSLRAALSALVLVGACTGGDRGSHEGAWEFRVDTVRSDSDGRIRLTTWLRAVGKEGARGAPQTKAVIFSFDCVPGHTSSAIMTDQALRQGSVVVQLKLDADPPRRLPGFAGTTPTGGQLVLTVPQDSVLALLSGHQQATIEYADGAESSKSTAVFSVAGLEKLRAPFLAACARRGGESK